MVPTMPDDDEDDAAAGAGGADGGGAAGEGAEGEGAEGGAGGDEGAEDVLVTICKAPDGSGYIVHEGDEPEEDEGEGAEGGGAAGAGGEGAAGGGEEEEGKHCATIGEALKAAMDILNKDAEEGDGGEGKAEDEFQAGYKGAGGGANA